MAYRYVLSDPHGCQEVFEAALGALDLTGKNHLYLLGDYIPHESVRLQGAEYYRKSVQALAFVKELQQEHAGQVTVLPGNHEKFLLEDYDFGKFELDGGDELFDWLRKLPPYVETDQQIFVHAGIDEEAEDLWKYGTDELTFTNKYPPTFGHFPKDIVAGHVGVSGECLANDKTFDEVFWDGMSHYYIDATTEDTGVMYLLRYNVERRRYQQQRITAQGAGPVRPIEAFQQW